MLTCKLGNTIINCYDGKYSKESLKEWSAKKILMCPVCNKPYEYCHGEVKSPYFRHIDKTKCKSLFSEPETEEHLNGKRDIYEWVKNQDGVIDAVLEVWIPKTKQRPDIMFTYNKKKYVIEYQCTPISSEYIKRHELYELAGINDIWICGTEKYLDPKKRLNTLEKSARLYYDSKNKCIFQMDDMNEKTYKETSKALGKLIKSVTRKRDKVSDDNINIQAMLAYYEKGVRNYCFIKGNSNSYYCSGLRYASPTGRASRKYPYPVQKYEYLRNFSIATCYKLNDIQLKKILKE